jgi:cathepsin L
MISKLVIATAAISSVSAASQHRFSRHFELENYSFDDYMKESGKLYTGAEKAMREGVFANNLKRIRAHNSGKASWKMGVNRFTDMTEDELKYFKGGNKHGLSSSKVQTAPSNVDISKLPRSVDWREAGVVTSVKDQGHCGSCWAHAAVETIESFVAINTGILTEVSQQELVSCMPNTGDCGGFGGCNGDIAEHAFDYMAQYGLPELWTYGYLTETYWYSSTNSNGACIRDEKYGTQAAAPRVVTGTGYTLLARNSYEAVMNAVATAGPVAVNVDASDWHLYESGVFTGCPQEDVDINHVVQLVGYGTDADSGMDYWLVRNSWSPTYGEDGYIRLERGPGYCGTDYHNQDGVGCASDPTNVTVCGMCGILYDVSYPTGAGLV